jgi:hypothetical protein
MENRQLVQTDVIHIQEKSKKLYRPEISKGTFLCIGFVALIFIGFGSVMGIGNMFSTMMKTAHDLLLNTALYIMGVAVLAGAISAVFSEFGVTALLNKLISVIMRPLMGLPGAAALGAVTTFFSDNPAIVPVSKDPAYAKYFKKYEWATMVNFGTVFGMGMIVVGGILGIQSGKYAMALGLGFVGAFIGGIVSVRLLLRAAKKLYGTEATVGNEYLDSDMPEVEPGTRQIRSGSAFQRGLNATFEGGKTGVELGLSIIPGILIFCTLVMMLTNGPSIVDGREIYVGAAYEGVGLLPWIGDKLSFILVPLFGFDNPDVLGLPLTSLGAVGASLAGAKTMADAGVLSLHDMTVYIAIGYCWAGFLSVHASMADSLKVREIVTKAMGTHFIGGLVAGVVANYLFKLIMLIIV